MKNILIFKVYMLIYLLIGIFNLGCTSTYDDRRSTSPHFKDGKFHNSVISKKGLWEAIKMRLSTNWADWPEFIETIYGPKPEKRILEEKIVVTHISHSTVLIQTGGYNILTDPIYSDSCSPVPYVVPNRVVKPGIKFTDLPKIDVVLISHDHYDHLDLPTIDRLIERDNPQFYLGLGVGRHLPENSKYQEMDWWEQSLFGDGLNIHFVPVQHFSGRSLFDRYATLWGGFVVEVKGKKIYFGGDAGYSDYYVQTFNKFGPMDISFLPIGAYKPRSFMSYVHMDPKEAVQAHLDLRSKLSVGIHYGTFQLTAEPYGEPEQLLEDEKSKAGIGSEEFMALKFGQPLIIDDTHLAQKDPQKNSVRIHNVLKKNKNKNTNSMEILGK